MSPELMAAIHAAAHPLVRAASEYGALPALRTEEFITAPMVVRQAVLAVLGEAWVIGDNAVDEWLTADYAGGKFHRNNAIPGIPKLNRRRYPPTGDRDLWVRHGPTGPPADLREAA